MKRPVNQERAIAYHLKQNPDLVPQMGVAGLSIGFRNKKTGEVEDKTLQALELNYNNHLKVMAEKRKAMQKGLKDGRPKREPKPRAIRTPRGGTQISLTGEDQ